MKRSFLFLRWSSVASGIALIAATYGLVRLAFGLHLPEMSADLTIDTAVAGLVSAAGSVVYAIAALVGFLVAERRPRLLIVAATATAAGGAAGLALAPHAAAFGFAATIASAGAGLASPALVRIVARTFADRDASTPQAVVNAGTGPGLIAAGILTIALAPDWRLSWAVAAFATLAAGIAVLVSDRLGEREREREPEHGPDAASTDAPHPLRRGAETRASRATAVPSPRWWGSHRQAIAAAVLLGFGAAAIWNYGRVVLVDAGASEAGSVMAWVLIGCGGTGVIATSAALRRLRPESLWTVAAVLVAAATFALGVAPTDHTVGVAAPVLFGWAYVTATGALIAWTTRVDPSYAAAGTAVLFVVFMVGQAIGAAVIGAILPVAAPGVAFGIAAAVSLAAGATAAVPRRTRVHAPPASA
ncbi:MFS transporter [Microbacterium sp. cf332]|uniref:MFS transporter n=1 Tax=Microbacterium sp. cf332 TaxID=1761804 RepID=UPI0015A1FA75|nr:MFS transporter [Microbacterium sp. cf332]